MKILCKRNRSAGVCDQCKKSLMLFRLYVACGFLPKRKLTVSMFVLDIRLHAWDPCRTVKWDFLHRLQIS